MQNNINYKVNVKFFITDKDIKEEITDKLNEKILNKVIPVNESRTQIRCNSADGTPVSNKGNICCGINSVDRFIAGTISPSGEVNFIVECNIEIFKPVKDAIYTGNIIKIVSDCIVVQVKEYLEITIIGTNKELKIGDNVAVKLINFKFMEKIGKFIGRGVI